MSAFVNPYAFAGAIVPPPVLNLPTQAFFDGWHTLSNSTAVPNAPVNSSSPMMTGRYGAGSAAARITGSGSRSLPITIAGMPGDYMFLGFNASWQVEAQAVVIAINRGATGGIAQGVNTVVRFRLEVGGGLTVLDSNGAVVGSVGSIPAPGSTWAWYDIKVKALGAGSLSVWREGVLVLDNVAGDFAGSSATGNAWGVVFTDDHDSGSDNAFSTAIGEVVIGSGDDTNDPWGEHRARVMLPDGISSAGSWVANAGTLATAVDELSYNSDTDYNSTSLTDDEFLLTFANPPVLAYCSGVKLISLIRRTIGTSQEQLVIKPPGQAALYSSAQANNTAYEARALRYQNNPNTGEAWTQAELEGITAGAKMLGAGDMRVTTCILQVLERL